MPVSQNGWPVSPNAADLGLVPFSIGGVNFGQVRGGKVYELLHYVATQVHNRVQKANQSWGCWGYSYRMNVNSPGVWSNHASGTAIDYNASMHPNGSPTYSNWTAAQIAEIHKILAEVGGRVRWGGDYHSTPDAMHFEINVPPSELDGGVPVAVPAAAIVKDVGAPGLLEDWRSIPELEEMSVSYPTMARYSPNGQAWWFFKPEKSGRVSIDALLSHYSDETVEAATPAGPNVTLSVYEANWDGYGDILETGALVGSSSTYSDATMTRNQGRVLITVEAEAGITYLIRTQASNGFPWIRTVVRVGEIVGWGHGVPGADPITGWIQPPIQTHVYGHELANNAPGSTGNVETMGCHIHQYLTPLHWGTRFKGIKSIGQSFGGPHPGLDAAARQCCWDGARREQCDSQTWGLTGSSTWNGTGMDGEPYDWGVGGFGFCVPPDDNDVNSRETSGFDEEQGLVGYTYQATDFLPGFWMGQIQYKVYATAIDFQPHEVLDRAGASGMGSDAPEEIPYLPMLEEGDGIQWESEGSTLVGLWCSPDELSGGGPNTAGVVAKWYLRPTALTEAEVTGAATPGGRWGPIGPNWYGQASPTGPISYVSNLIHIADYIGGLSGWTMLSPGLWQEALENQMPIQFSALPDHIFEATVPDVLDINAMVVEAAALRLQQFMAIRAEVLPSRYRIVRDPGIPDITWNGNGALLMDPTCGGRTLY